MISIRFCVVRFCFALACAGAIVGCVSTAPPPAAAAAAAPMGTPLPVVDEALPNVYLTGNLLYQLMAAEVALQRGDAGSAYATLFSVARQTKDPRIARRATEIAINARSWPQALEAAQLWRTLAPQSAEAQQATAALLVGNNRLEEAAQMFSEQIKNSPMPAAELARIQRLLARAPDQVAALALLLRLATPFSDDPVIGADVRLTLAHAANAAGQTQLAAQQAEAALERRPDFELAALTAAQFLARPANKDDAAGRVKALQLLKGFVEHNPKALNVRMTYARLLVADGKYADARGQFEQVLAADERNLDALYAVGVLALDGAPPRDAARAYLTRYLKVLAETPGAERDPDPAYFNLARLAEEEKKYTEALNWLDKIDGEQALSARLRKALVLGKMKRVEEGRQLLAATTPSTNEERTQLLLTEAQLLREARRYTESLDLLTGALRGAPEDTALLYDAAMAAERLDRVDVMETHLRRVMSLKPNDAQAFNALGYSLADRNQRLQEAHDLIAQALKLAPDDGYILDSMGWVQFRLGNLNEARGYLERAWRVRPHAEVGAHLGEVLWTRGERDAARNIWRNARALEPDNETLRATLSRLKARL